MYLRLPFDSRRFSPGIFLLWLACFAGVYGFSVPPPSPPEVDVSQIALDFVEAREVVKKNHAGEIDEERMCRNGIEGMLRTLDPHCAFFSPDAYHSFINAHPKDTCGVGAVFVSAGGKVFFREAVPGSPAAATGLHYGDELLSINGESVAEWDLSRVYARLSGSCATMVTLTVARQGFRSPIDFSIKRRRQSGSSLRPVFMVGAQAGYIPFRAGFSDEDFVQMIQAVHHLKSLGARAILLDLRDNPGGLVNVARDVAAFFLSRDLPVVILRGRNLPGRSPQTVLFSRTAHPELLPLVILTNRQSASAAEIVVGALQDNDRAWVVGERTFGKALVQSAYSLPDGYGLLLTSSRYYTPSGRYIQRPYETGRYYSYRQGQDHLISVETECLTGMAGYHVANREPMTYETGGIPPDSQVVLPVSPPARKTLASLTFLFVRELTSELVPGFKRHHLMEIADMAIRNDSHPAVDELMKRFRQFTASTSLPPHMSGIVRRIPEQSLRQQLLSEIVTAIHGAEKGNQVFLLNDPVILRAVAEVPQAERRLNRLLKRDASQP